MGNGAPPPGSPRKQEQHLYQSATPLDTRSQLLQPPLPHHDSMSAFQHMLPTIVASKQHQHQQSDMVLDNQPSGLWSSDDYDSMMRSILDATLPSDHFVDLEAPPSLASFSASYAGSFVSGSSDSGASPNSINDLIYGASNFPTPPDSDLGSNPRNLSFSMASQAGTAFSPDGSLDLSNPSYPQSYAGSDTTSPFAHNFAVQGTSSTSPFGLHTVQLPPASIPPNNPNAQPWNPNFLAPATANNLHPPTVSEPYNETTATSVEPMHNATNTVVGTKRGADAPDSDTAVAHAPSSAIASKSSKAALPQPDADSAARKTKKAKSTPAPSESKPSVKVTAVAPAPAHINHMSSKLPHMEVGSNATALAAIQRLKAKRLQESQAAANAASALAAAHGTSQTAASATSADRQQLDPATRQQKKVAHNAIERRYRNNINDRIAALRRAVPALREIRPRKTPSGRRSRKAQQEEDLVDGVPAATKLNKATILGKATDYIKYLKSRELRLTSEVAGLRELVRSLEGGEELLELWEAEMDKVVAEQEALAAAAAAKEDEEAQDEADASLNAGADDDDDDEEVDDDDDEADTGESSYNSASSSSPPSARRRTGSKAGRGRRSGIAATLSSVASSRYMLATFLGISFIGSGAEFALDASASDASEAVARPAPAKLMVGASRQLLKRSAGYVAPSTSIAQDPHAFDSVPSHALAFEVLRIVSFAFLFLFLVWPIFSRFLPKARSSSSVDASASSDDAPSVHSAESSRKLRVSLTKGDISVAAFDSAARSNVSAPLSAPMALPSILGSSLRLVLGRNSRLHRFVPVQHMSSEEAGALCRLLEVETLCEAKAQASSLLRLHTALRLANSQYVRGSSHAASRDPASVRPRLLATLALAFARLGDGVNSAQDFADSLWIEARSCLRAADAESSPTSALLKDDGLTQVESASWLSSVLSLDLDTALDMLASASASSDLRNHEFSAVLGIADVHYCARLSAVWNRLLASVVRASCPPSSMAPSKLVHGFVTLQSKQRLELDVVHDAETRRELHAEITMLARTAPPTACAWQMAQVTLATWSAVLGNLGVARHVASTLRDQPMSAQSELASVAALYAFVDANAAPEPATTPTPRNEVDARAVLLLAWLSFLRMFADARTDVKRVHAATLHVRKLVSAAAPAAALDEASAHELDELDAGLDTITELCTALGRAINRLPSSATSASTAPLKALVDAAAAADDDRDSGIEL